MVWMGLGLAHSTKSLAQKSPQIGDMLLGPNNISLTNQPVPALYSVVDPYFLLVHISIPQIPWWIWWFGVTSQHVRSRLNGTKRSDSTFLSPATPIASNSTTMTGAKRTWDFFVWQLYWSVSITFFSCTVCLSYVCFYLSVYLPIYLSVFLYLYLVDF